MPPLKHYAYTLLGVAVVTLLGWLLRALLSPINLALLYLPVIVLSASAWGLGPSIFASLVSVLILDAIFVPPYGVLSISSPQDIVTYVVFLVIGIVTSQLSGLVREQVQLARSREQQNAALYALSQEIAYRTDRDWILNAALKNIETFFGAGARIFLPDASNQLQPYGEAPVLPQERTMAQWVYVQGQPAQTPVLSGATFLPIRTAGSSWGVLALRRVPSRRHRAAEERRTLEAFSAQIALALERVNLADEVQEARLRQASERFSEALLAALSHDLRTPLAAIVGSTTTFLDPTTTLEPGERTELVETIHTEAARLNRLVNNLIEMTRLEAGGLKPQRAWNSIAEVIEATLAHLNAPARPIELAVQPDLPLVSFDFVLVQEVLVNLIENAIKYSPPGTPIEIAARLWNDTIHLTVTDHGAGIPTQELTRVFDKNYRMPRDRHMPGSGMGLLICKGIVEAHGGRIFANSIGERGTQITFTLPAAERIKLDE